MNTKEGKQMLKLGVVVISTLMLAGAVLAGCGGGSKKTIDVPGGGKVSVSDKLPSGFPDDFPVYKGAKVQGSLSGSSNGISGTTVTWESGDDLSKVTDFYTNEFGKDAWKATSNGTINDSSYWSGENAKGDKEMYVLVSTTDGKTNIIATIGDKQDTSSGSDGGSSGGSLTSANKTATSEAEDSGSDGSEPTSSGPAKTSTPSPLPSEVALSKDFPKDKVPLPSDARVTSNTSFGQGNQKTFIITYFTKDDPEKVSQYFSDEMPKHGWSNAFTSNSDGDYFVTFTGTENADGGSDGLTMSATASTDSPGYTEVSVSVSMTTTGG
jgi:hypothetical protein